MSKQTEKQILDNVIQWADIQIKRTTEDLAEMGMGADLPQFGKFAECKFKFQHYTQLKRAAEDSFQSLEYKVGMIKNTLLGNHLSASSSNQMSNALQNQEREVLSQILTSLPL